MSATFAPSTVEQILGEIRSIANAADFGTFVAKRTAEDEAIQKQARLMYRSRDPEPFFPSDPDSSMLDALLDKICDLAPVALPQAQPSRDDEHPWLACMRKCLCQNVAFSDKENPRYVDVIRRFVDLLITCFADLETSNNGKTNFALVMTTLLHVLGYHEIDLPRLKCCASETLIDFLMKHNGCERSQDLLAGAIVYSVVSGKWIVQIAEKNPQDRILHKIGNTIYTSKSAPPSFSDPEQLRLCFRAFHILKNKSCCNDLAYVLTAAFGKTSSVSSSFLNAPLNLPDEQGNIIDDTPLSIACNRRRYCKAQFSKFSCQCLIKLGADVNGLVDDPADSTKKIVSRRDGKTPLMLACVSGDDENVELFLKNKDLDLSLKDNEGKSVVNYLLRRFECRRKFLDLLHKRDPSLCESHVSITDLDFAVRNCLETSVTFLLSLKNVHFNATELQELAGFCFEELLTIRSQATVHEDPIKNKCETKKRDEEAENEDGDDDGSADFICCKNCDYEGLNPQSRAYRKAQQPQKVRYLSFLNICVRGLSDRLRESGCKSIAVSLAGRRDRTPPADDDKNEMKRPAFLCADSDDDSSEDDQSDQ